MPIKILEEMLRPMSPAYAGWFAYHTSNSEWEFRQILEDLNYNVTLWEINNYLKEDEE
jgi:hypothetical protein